MMDPSGSFHVRRVPTARGAGLLMGAILLLAGGCARSDSSESSQAAGSSEPSVIEHFTGKSTVDAGQRTKRALTQATLREAVNRYKAITGTLPETLEDLVYEGLLQTTFLVDEWGSPLSGSLEQGTFTVRSPGVDRAAGTGDDWTLEFQ